MARPRTIALLNQKGGVGKTTSTVNIGAALALAGKRVCLIDLDPQAHLTLHLGLDPDQLKHSVYDLLVDESVAASDAVVTARENLDVIGAEVDLAGAETELASHPDRQQILRRKFAAIQDRYDVILLDCPPSLGLLTLNALALAGEVIVPMQAHFLALQGVSKLLETVSLVGRSVNPALRVSGILLCMHEGQTTLAREIVADLQAFFDQARDQHVPWNRCCVLMPAVRRNIKLAEAPSFGQSIFDYEPWCPGALDYRKLAENVLAMAPQKPPESAPESATEPATEPAPESARASAPSPRPAHASAPVAQPDADGHLAPDSPPREIPEIVVRPSDASSKPPTPTDRASDHVPLRP